MVVLLSVGEAMLDQCATSRWWAAGRVTVLPQGIDVEAMRTGRPRRDVLRHRPGALPHPPDRSADRATPRWSGPWRPPSRASCSTSARHAAPAAPMPVRAGGEIPSRAAALGAGSGPARGTLDRLAGRLRLRGADAASSSTTSSTAFTSRAGPTAPGASGTTSTSSPAPTSGGTSPTSSAAMSLTPDRQNAGAAGCWSPTAGPTAGTTGSPPTPRRPRPLRHHAGRPHHRRELPCASATASTTCALGAAGARRGGPARPRPSAAAQPLLPAGRAAGRRVPLRLRRPRSRRLGGGRICVGGRLPSRGARSRLSRSQLGRLARRDLGVGRGPGRASESALRRRLRTPRPTTSPFFLTLVDSLGVRQVLRFGRIAYEAPSRDGALRHGAPALRLVGTRDADTVTLDGGRSSTRSPPT